MDSSWTVRWRAMYWRTPVSPPSNASFLRSGLQTNLSKITGLQLFFVFDLDSLGM
jgi:hypothetical protein